MRTYSKRLDACLIPESGGSVHASFKRLVACMFLESGSSVHVGSKRVATCVCVLVSPLLTFSPPGERTETTVRVNREQFVSF